MRPNPNPSPGPSQACRLRQLRASWRERGSDEGGSEEAARAKLALMRRSRSDKLSETPFAVSAPLGLAGSARLPAAQQGRRPKRASRAMRIAATRAAGPTTW